MQVRQIWKTGFQNPAQVALEMKILEGLTLTLHKNICEYIKALIIKDHKIGILIHNLNK